MDIRIPHSWYANSIIVRDLGRQALHDYDKLNELLLFIGKAKKEQRWEFYYTAAEMLRTIALHGDTQVIRTTACEGGGEGRPGLNALARLNTLKLYRDMDKLKHFSKPRKIDPNPKIRTIAINFLIEIVKHAPDENVKQMAQTVLASQYRRETVEEIKDLLKPYTLKKKTTEKKSRKVAE